MKMRIEKLCSSGNALRVDICSDIVLCISYSTVVCAVMKEKFQRYWPGESFTTMRHIDAFCRTFSSDPWPARRVGGSMLANWRALPVVKEPELTVIEGK